MRKLNNDEILRVLHAVAEADHTDMIWWRTDDEYAPVTFLVNCNDCFYWATADCEEITPDKLQLFEQTLKDAKAACDGFGTIYAGELFAARCRKLRPQNASYALYPPEMWGLFDESGPPRDTDAAPFGNPRSREKAWKQANDKWIKMRAPTEAAKEYLGKDGRSHWRVTKGNCGCGASIINEFEWQQHLKREQATEAGQQGTQEKPWTTLRKLVAQWRATGRDECADALETWLDAAERELKEADYDMDSQDRILIDRTWVKEHLLGKNSH